MKKILFSALILSLLLATLTACGAEAKQPDEPAPAPKVDQTEPVAKPEPLSAPEKVEISQEELEPIFEKVFIESSGNHPEDWSIDFQITDEIGKITKAIAEDKKAPSNLREIYSEWRVAKTEPEPVPEPMPVPEPLPEPEPEPKPEPKPQDVFTSTEVEETPDTTDIYVEPNPSGGKSYYGGFNTYEEYINDLHRTHPDFTIEELKEYFPDQAKGQIGAAASGDKKDNLLTGN